MSKLFIRPGSIRGPKDIYKIDPRSFYCAEICTKCNECVNRLSGDTNWAGTHSYEEDFFFEVWWNKIKHWWKHWE